MKTPWLVVATTLLAVIALCCSCFDKGNHGAHFRDRVNSVKELNLPSDAVVTNNSGVFLSRFSAEAHWEFETHEQRRAYLSRVREQLERADFKLQSSGESSLLLTKTSQNEAESLKIQAAPSSYGLRVQIAFAIDSDELFGPLFFQPLVNITQQAGSQVLQRNGCRIATVFETKLEINSPAKRRVRRKVRRQLDGSSKGVRR